MKHKKSKYKSLVINKKRYYFYADGSEFSKFQPATMISYGYIFSKDNQCLRSFASHDSKEDSFSDRNVYPIGCIKSLEKINI